MMSESNDTGKDLAVTLAVAGLGYLRWTQLVPMLMAWSFLLLMLGAMVLVNFQEQSFSALVWVDDLYIRLMGEEGEAQAASPAAPAAPAGDEAAPRDGESRDGEPEGALHFDGGDVEGWIWRGWAIVSLIGWLLGGLWRQLFGPGGEPWSLGRKLGLCAVCAGFCSLGLLVIWNVSSVPYHGSAAGWVALFVGIPVGVWLVSAWSLAISHLLGALAEHLQRAR